METALKFGAALVHTSYMLLVIVYGLLFFAAHRRAQQLARPTLLLTLIVHLAYLVLLGVRFQQFPAATISQALSTVAFAVIAAYAFVEWRGREPTTGFWMVSLACVFEVLSSLLRSEEPPYREIFHSPFFAAHTAMGLLGYAAFVIAAGYGFLFLRLYAEIKQRRFSLFFDKLPPLEVLERLMTVALFAGFVALTGSVVLGAVWAEQLFGNSWLTDPKILFTLGTWLFYGVSLVLHRLRQWHGRETAWISLTGLGAILISFVAVNWMSHLHDFQ